MTTQSNRSRRRARQVLAALAVTVTGAAVLSSMAPAVAAPATGAGVSRTVSAAELSVFDRMSAEQISRIARPHELPVAPAQRTPGEQAGPDGPTQRYEGTLPRGGAAAPTGRPPVTDAAAQNGLWPYSYNSNPNLQVGKLYFDRQPGVGVNWGHCSATVVTSANRSTLITAGHCVYNPDPDQNGVVSGNGYWHESLYFCPGYEYGCQLGIWYARQLATTNSWFYGYGSARSYDFRDDVAVVLVSPNSSGYVVDRVGAQGITFNAGTRLNRTALGYPAADHRFPEYSYNGEDLIWCGGRDTNDTYYVGTMWLPCTMTGGSSGGPWLINANAQWLGYVNSVNSHKPYGGLYMNGPYFDSAESSLYSYWRTR